MIAVMATIAIVCNVNAQQTVVIQNSEEAKKTVGTDGSFYINGISSKEDIGGVEATVWTDLVDSDNWNMTKHYDCYVSLKNYHKFPVTVLYQAGPSKATGSVVLEPGAKADRKFATVKTGYYDKVDSKWHSVFTITRKL